MYNPEWGPGPRFLNLRNFKIKLIILFQTHRARGLDFKYITWNYEYITQFKVQDNELGIK